MPEGKVVPAQRRDQTHYRSYAKQGKPFLAGILLYRNLELVDLPTGHWPMWSRPADLARIVFDAAAPPA
jgi:hypothetical protein